ncbi:MAG: hypothetical protein AB7P12_18790 [Alphaproteobacteria bacterium]
MSSDVRAYPKWNSFTPFWRAARVAAATSSPASWAPVGNRAERRTDATHEKLTEDLFTYVAIDDQGRPRPVDME